MRRCVLHPAAAGVGAERDPGGRRSPAALRRGHGGRAHLLGQMVQGQRGVLPLRAQGERQSIHRLRRPRHPRQQDALQLQEGAARPGHLGQQRPLQVRGVGRGALLLVGQRRRQHGGGLPARRSARHQRRQEQLPARRSSGRQLHVGGVQTGRPHPVVHQRQEGQRQPDAPVQVGQRRGRPRDDRGGAGVHRQGVAPPRRQDDAALHGHSDAGGDRSARIRRNGPRTTARRQRQHQPLAQLGGRVDGLAGLLVGLGHVQRHQRTPRQAAARHGVDGSAARSLVVVGQEPRSGRLDAAEPSGSLSARPTSRIVAPDDQHCAVGGQNRPGRSLGFACHSVPLSVLQKEK